MYKILNDSEIHCLECGGPVYGRPDKKFCSSSCKNKYHGHLRYTRDKMKLLEMDYLVQNYCILETIMCLDKSTCSLESLKNMGFCPEYVTQVIKKGKHLEYRCFDFSYSISGGRLSGLRRID